MPRKAIADPDSIETEPIESKKDIQEGDWILVDQRSIDEDSYAATVTEIIGKAHCRIDVNPDDPDDPGMAIDLPLDDYEKVTEEDF